NELAPGGSASSLIRRRPGPSTRRCRRRLGPAVGGRTRWCAWPAASRDYGRCAADRRAAVRPRTVVHCADACARAGAHARGAGGAAATAARVTSVLARHGLRGEGGG